MLFLHFTFFALLLTVRSFLTQDGYLAGSALNLMNWRNNSASMMAGYPHHRYPHQHAYAAMGTGHQQFTNSNCAYPNDAYQQYHPAPPLVPNDVEMCGNAYEGAEFVPQLDEQNAGVDCTTAVDDVIPPPTQEFGC